MLHCISVYTIIRTPPPVLPEHAIQHIAGSHTPQRGAIIRFTNSLLKSITTFSCGSPKDIMSLLANMAPALRLDKS